MRIDLDEDLSTAVREAAAEEGRTEAEIVAIAVRIYVCCPEGERRGLALMVMHWALSSLSDD